jgi:hypothetical protein
MKKKSTEKRKDVRYKKVWKITERKEGHVNKEHVQEIFLLEIVVKDESTDRKKKSELREIMNLPMKMMMNLLMKMMMNTHQSRNCSEPYGLETPK